MLLSYWRITALRSQWAFTHALLLGVPIDTGRFWISNRRLVVHARFLQCKLTYIYTTRFVFVIFIYFAFLVPFKTFLVVF